MMRTTLIALALLAGCKSKDADDSKKIDLAQLAAKKYAFEAYPQWAARHPEKECPAQLAELNEFTNATDTKDPWGNDFKMGCGSSVPAGAKVFGVWSLGPDGKDGTADDIKSWK